MAVAGQRLDVLEPHNKVLLKAGREFFRVLSSCGNPSPENKDWHAHKSASNSTLIEHKPVKTLIRQRTWWLLLLLLLLLLFLWERVHSENDLTIQDHIFLLILFYQSSNNASEAEARFSQQTVSNCCQLITVRACLYQMKHLTDLCQSGISLMAVKLSPRHKKSLIWGFQC